MAVALDRGFFETLPKLEPTTPEAADVAWLVYDLELNGAEQRYSLTRHEIVYTAFGLSLDRITRPEPGDPSEFIKSLQIKLEDKLESENPPETQNIEVDL